jgi:hypothetical protein
MRAVAALRHREIRPVIDEERHAARLYHRPQHVDRAPQRVIVQVLEAELHRRHVPGIQRRR